MKRYATVALLFVLAPGCLLAHGVEVVLLPMGEAAGVIIVGVLAILLRMSIGWRVAFVALALAGSVGGLFLPSLLYFVVVERFGTSGWPWFALGLLTPLVCALSPYVMFGCSRRTSSEPEHGSITRKQGERDP